ncbi:peptidoglycan-binding protein [Pseudanabaena sp. UWO311]|uniref:peptidoglycan-binding domain-containing protein n=1 Tax=Pseudanabaena sp. UWO311 TaxID=2487337 RepID=UPI00115B9435|nr:peptidoglycan-binding protein [Pseudanabaena sp. UWO311]TYQ26807.1 peptidoglycan-binding protein [Pseudanabaena sp. UWO311]
MDSILRQGSKGSAVSELQQLLQSKGFYSGKIDGDFGAGTTNAVLKFQKENGLVPDGIVGSSSWAKLRAGIPTSAQGLPTLLPGSKGAAVSQAQQLLKDKGYYQGRIDGDFGVGTRDAIAAFQRANGLTVDGKVGEQTWKKLQAPAISNVTPPVTVVEIVRPSSPTPTPVTPSPTPSIFVPSPTIPVTANNPSVSTPLPVPSASAISLVDAANSYSRARLPNQTAAINNLQASVTPEILQQFFQRWQIASGQATTSTSLQDALGGYNSAQMLNQNLALQWLQSQLLSQALAQFRQDWSNLNAGTGTGTTTPFTPIQPTPSPTNNPQLQLINLTAAVKAYTRTANQLTALENLQASLPLQTMQQFFQRWSLASGQTAITISLVDVFQDYDSQKFPSQVTALQELEKELTTANLEKFSKDWQTI